MATQYSNIDQTKKPKVKLAATPSQASQGDVGSQGAATGNASGQANQGIRLQAPVFSPGKGLNYNPSAPSAFPNDITPPRNDIPEKFNAGGIVGMVKSGVSDFSNRVSPVASRLGEDLALGTKTLLFGQQPQSATSAVPGGPGTTQNKPLTTQATPVSEINKTNPLAQTGLIKEYSGPGVDIKATGPGLDTGTRFGPVEDQTSSQRVKGRGLGFTPEGIDRINKMLAYDASPEGKALHAKQNETEMARRAAEAVKLENKPQVDFAKNLDNLYQNALLRRDLHGAEKIAGLLQEHYKNQGTQSVTRESNQAQAQQLGQTAAIQATNKQTDQNIEVQKTNENLAKDYYNSVSDLSKLGSAPPATRLFAGIQALGTAPDATTTFGAEKAKQLNETTDPTDHMALLSEFFNGNQDAVRLWIKTHQSK